MFTLFLGGRLLRPALASVAALLSSLKPAKKTPTTPAVPHSVVSKPPLPSKEESAVSNGPALEEPTQERAASVATTEVRDEDKTAEAEKEIGCAPTTDG